MSDRISILFACTVLVAPLALAGCGLFQDEVTKTVQIPIEFTIDADKLCERATGDKIDCESSNQDIPDDQYPIPLGDFEYDQDVDVIELTDRDDLQDITDRLKRVSITKIEYDVQDTSDSNTLSVSIPTVDLHMGPKAAESKDDQKFSSDIVKLATFKRVPPGETPSREINVPRDVEKQTSNFFKALQFSALPSGQPKVRKEDDLPPSGKAKVELTLHVKFVAKPSEAL